LRPHVRQHERWASLRTAVNRGFSSDFLEHGREQPEEQERPDLDRAFR
jgi:antitoxin VapB